MTPTGVATEAAAVFREVFGERMLGAYLIGSLAHGGYSPWFSDIDLAVVLSDVRSGDPPRVAAATRAVRDRGPLHRTLSVFWASAAALTAGRDDGRFPPYDRLDLADHGRLLTGHDTTRTVARPTPTELLRDTARFALRTLATDEVTAVLRDPPRLAADPRWTKAVLFPVRFLHTLLVAPRITPVPAVLTWYLRRSTRSHELVRATAAARAGARPCPRELGPLLATGLLPLYRDYITTHADRLRTGTDTSLSAGLEAWWAALSSEDPGEPCRG